MDCNNWRQREEILPRIQSDWQTVSNSDKPKKEIIDKWRRRADWGKTLAGMIFNICSNWWQLDFSRFITLPISKQSNSYSWCNKNQTRKKKFPRTCDVLATYPVLKVYPANTWNKKSPFYKNSNPVTRDVYFISSNLSFYFIAFSWTFTYFSFLLTSYLRSFIYSLYTNSFPSRKSKF